MEEKFRELGFATKCIHAGNAIDKETGALRRPITMANSYELSADRYPLDWGDSDSLVYARNGSSNQHYLQECLAAIEGGEDCMVVASGVAALSAVFFTFLNSGDHVICTNISYIAVYRLMTEYFPQKYNIEVSLIDTSDIREIEKAIKPNTKIIHIETPGNPTTGITDIAAVAKVAKAASILLSVDSTWATPMLQQPLSLGADLVVHSISKYVNGHGDALGGAVIGKKDLIRQIKTGSMVNQGGVISPFNAWLITRGLVTLPIRMKLHCENAMKIALFLEASPAVDFVAYPGLAGHPQHELAKKQMSGFSGMMAFGLKADIDTHMKFARELEIVTFAVSLGHDESLIVYTGPDDSRIRHYPENFRRGFFRLSVGLEDVEDLIHDIGRSLIKCGLAK